MPRSLRWLAAVLVLVLVATVLFWARGNGQTRVALGGNREMRVLKISYGTNHVFSAEPRWKQCLRAVLPTAWQQPLGRFQGQRFSTPHDTLVVWIGEFNMQTGSLYVGSAGTLVLPEAVFANGYVAHGRRRATANDGSVALEFPCYPRNASRLTFRIHDRTNSILFAVDNPRRVKAASWIGRSLPQTNHSIRTQIVLKDVGHGSVLVQARSAGESVPGWTAWRVTAFDAWGNWAGDSWAYADTGLPRLPLLPPEESPFKLVIEEQEYISAGRVWEPTSGTSLVLAPSPRMQDFGVGSLVLVGSGSYQIHIQVSGTEVQPTVDRPLSPSNNLALAFSAASAPTNSLLYLVTPRPGIFCLSGDTDQRVISSARLRERNEFGGGRIFGQASAIRATHLASKRIAQFFPVLRPSPARQPSPPATLEAEVIVNLPATEFYVNRPTH